jgi:hypothetical protein
MSERCPAYGILRTSKASDILEIVWSAGKFAYGGGLGFTSQLE